MLDNAHTCLQMLANEQAPSVPTVAPLDPSAFARTLQIPSVAPMQGDEGETTDVGIAAPTLAAKPAAAPQLATADPELLALFIEEAREELAKVQKHFPGWEQNPLEQDGLITIRRSFHTLKGSGRMVGARDLSEFAWAIENLLNRLLDNTVTRSPQILAVLRDAVAVLPSLIDQLETHRVPTGDVPGIVSRAHSLASTKPAGHETPKLAAVPEAAAPAPAEKKIPAVAPPPPAPPPAPSASPSISVAAAPLASEGAQVSIARAQALQVCSVQLAPVQVRKLQTVRLPHVLRAPPVHRRALALLLATAARRFRVARAIRAMTRRPRRISGQTISSRTSTRAKPRRMSRRFVRSSSVSAVSPLRIC
jgi:chemotaxis protein histidine kinase CheA